MTSNVEQTVQPKMEFQTGIQHVFYRTKESSIIARSVICKVGETEFPIIQVGRFKNGWEASKYLMALNDEETQWLIDFIPAMVKRAYKHKADTGDVFESKEFCQNRSISVALISFKKKKQLEFTQITIRNDDEVKRVVSFPVQTVSDMREKLCHLQIIHKMMLDAEFRLTKTEGVFEAFLAYVHHSVMVRATNDPSLISVMDEDLLSRMKASKDVVANFWIASKYISVSFEAEFQLLLTHVFSNLGIQQFDETRLTSSRLLDTYGENPVTFLQTELMEMFKLVKFIVDNKNTI